MGEDPSKLELFYTPYWIESLEITNYDVSHKNNPADWRDSEPPSWPPTLLAWFGADGGGSVRVRVAQAAASGRWRFRTLVLFRARALESSFASPGP